jgi:hypothetical protein
MVPLRSYTYQDLKISWSQEGNRLFVKSSLGRYFFIVPSDWKLRKWSPALRKLAEVLIFYQFWRLDDLRKFMKTDWTPWLTPPSVVGTIGTTGTIGTIDTAGTGLVNGENAGTGSNAEVSVGETGTVGEISVIEEEECRNTSDIVNPHLRRWQRRQELSRNAISFSGGLDSCAIVPLLPDTPVLVYLKRKIEVPTNIRHTQQLRALDFIKKNYSCITYIMESDIELLALHSIGRIGFPSEYACTLPCVILGDHAGITAICTGTLSLFLKFSSYHEFNKTRYYSFWKELFSKAGIDLFWPVGGVLDRGTAIICQKTHIPGQSCVRNDDGACNKCFKCFRKNVLLGTIVKPDPKPIKLIKPITIKTTSLKILIPEDAKDKLLHKPLTLIELYQLGIIKDARLAPYKEFDLSYQSHYLKEAYDYLVPDYLRQHICEKLDKYLGPMTDQQIKLVKELDMSKLAKIKINLG